MNDWTHYWVAFVVIILESTLFHRFSLLEQLALIPIAGVLSYCAVLPNKLDKFFSITPKTHTRVERSRHPASHHPLLIVFVFLLYILVYSKDLVKLEFLYLFKLGFYAFGSHLLLDSFTKEGLPLGLAPSLFAQDLTKYYSYHDNYNSRGKFQLQKNIYSDDIRYNRLLVYFCQGFVVSHGLNVIIRLLIDSKIFLLVHHLLLLLYTFLW